jgi:hypothetical protein
MYRSIRNFNMPPGNMNFLKFDWSNSPPPVQKMYSNAPLCDHWWTLDFANAFVCPGVNSRAELMPSPWAYARNGAPRRWLGDETWQWPDNVLQQASHQSQIRFRLHCFLPVYTILSYIQLFQLRLSPEQSGKVEYERERLLGIANKWMNLLAIPSSLSRSYSTFPLCSGDNLNWNSCIRLSDCHLDVYEN